MYALAGLNLRDYVQTDELVDSGIMESRGYKDKNIQVYKWRPLARPWLSQRPGLAGHPYTGRHTGECERLHHHESLKPEANRRRPGGGTELT